MVRATELATKRSCNTEEPHRRHRARDRLRRAGLRSRAVPHGARRGARAWARDPETDVSGNDPIVTGKIALAHLTEFPDYYSCLTALEREAEEHLRSPA
jgi:hypothetical protein